MLQILSQRLLMLADETVYKEWEDRMERDTTNSASFSVIGPRCQVTILGGAKAQTRFEAASKQSNDPSLARVNILESGEDSMKLNELMELCKKLSDISVRNALCNEIEVNVGNSNLMLLALETSIRSDLNLEDAGGTDCLPTDTIFEELRGDGSYTPITTQPSTSKPKKKQSKRKQKKDIETTKTTKALEIASLKSRVKQLEKKANKRTHKFKRLYRVGSTKRVESLNDEGLGAQEDASKHGRSIKDIGKDAKVSLVDETQGRSNDTEMFDTDALIVSTAAPSTTAASPPVITEVEITLA
ncbi:hypothetical protein Tco_1577559 [Tanacetum coccineum]